nr:MAG TPA: cytokine receptor common subunit [Caudoviricetes sp.]
MRFKRITDSTAHAYLSKVTDADKAYTDSLVRPFDAESITYNTKPNNISASTYNKTSISRGWNEISTYVTKYGIWYGIAFFLPSYSDGSVAVTTSGTNAPYLTITVDDSDTIGLELSNLSPASGAVIKTQDNLFAWSARAANYSCAPEVEQASAVFRWRSGTSGTIHTINVSGNTQSVTVPANTFAGTTSIQWQVAVTANSGVVTTSNWVTISTADATPTAAPLSPVDTVIDGSKDVLFKWQHSISTGTAQSKADLQKSADGSTWQTLATVNGSARQWTCPAGTLTSSIKYWRVRTYNADGVAGAWSDAAQIVVIAAPTAPSIQIKSTGPRPSISWQTSEQEAYQVELDGVLSGGTHYGTEKTWTSPAYLADGSHTVRVRVQNQYGMWSDWGAAALPVTNTPGASITLTVQASSVADLSWQTSGSYDFYLVYRNEKPIAKLTQTQYTDELSSGSTTYQVRGCYADSSNYGLSSAVTVDVRAEVHQVSDLDTGQTLRLPYSDSQHRQTTRTLSRQVELLQLSGAYYPVAVEVDSGTDALSITAALLDESEIRQLMGLVGKLVCAKTPQGDMVIGYITSLPKQHDGFLNVFNFTIEQIDFDDEVRL